jgi:hypothetical protein
VPEPDRHAPRRVPHHRGLFVESADHLGRVVSTCLSAPSRARRAFRASATVSGSPGRSGVSLAYPFSSKNSTHLASQLEGSSQMLWMSNRDGAGLLDAVKRLALMPG